MRFSIIRMGVNVDHSEQNSPAAIEVPSKKKRRFGKALLNIAILAAVFWLGLSIGTGALQISTNSPIGSNQGLPADLDYSEVERVYDLLRENYDGELSVEQLLAGLKGGLVEASGDAYTEFLTAEEADEFNKQLSGTFSGIGAELGKDEDGNLIIVAPIDGFPADKAGLRSRDVILLVDDTNASGMSIQEAVSRIRGKSGSDVKLTVLRNDTERLEFTITRANITVPSVDSEILDGNVGYLEITQFWTDTDRLAREAVREFQQAGVKKVILDLRGNPGGSLDAAVDVASIWLPSGKTVLEERRDGKTIQVYKAAGNALLEGVDTIVLIDEGSASASEIVAGALKDNGAATLLGQRSYGKGSVQQIIPLRDGSELKVTIAKWYRPSGENIDEKGIAPDVSVEYTDDDFEADRDPQRDAALKRLR